MAQATRHLPPIFFPRPCKGHPNLVFDLIGPTDVNEVSEFVMNEFFHRFPLKDILQVDKEVRPWINDYISHVCSKNFSVVLRDIHRGYRIVAAAINDVDHEEREAKDINLFTYADPVDRPGWHKICCMLSELNKGLTFSVDPILSMDIILKRYICNDFLLQAIGESYCNRGLSALCAQLTVELAEIKGINLIKIEVVNDYMSAMLTKVGFKMIKEIDISQVEVGGVRPFVYTSYAQKARVFIYTLT